MLKKDIKEVTASGGWLIEEPEVKQTGEKTQDPDNADPEVNEDEPTADSN